MNARDVGGSTPLHKAAYLGHVEVVRALLRAGANPSLADDDEKFPIHEAALGGHSDVIELLSRTPRHILAPILKPYISNGVFKLHSKKTVLGTPAPFLFRDGFLFW